MLSVLTDISFVVVVFRMKKRIFPVVAEIPQKYPLAVAFEYFAATTEPVALKAPSQHHADMEKASVLSFANTSPIFTTSPEPSKYKLDAAGCGENLVVAELLGIYVWIFKPLALPHQGTRYKAQLRTPTGTQRVSLRSIQHQGVAAG